MRTSLSLVVGLGLALVAPSALAQDTQGGAAVGGSVGASTGAAGAVGTTPAPAPAPAPADTGAAATGTGAVSTTTTVAPPAVTTAADAHPAAADDDVPDHDKFVGHLAVGYLGLTNLPLGSGGPTAEGGANAPTATLATPVVGVRYWINHLIGIDGGLGFALASRSSETETNNNTQTLDGASPFGVAIHGGVPLAIATGKHYTFEIIPEANVGFTSQTDKSNAPANPPPDVKHSGFRLDVGARVGGEVHFGFIGVPELSLVATVGLQFRRQVWHSSQDQGNGVPTPQSSSFGLTELGTTVQSDPWAIFVNNISAFYYF
jgi:hypothetical protein